MKDNTNRILLCTLQNVAIPAKYFNAIDLILKPVEDEDLLPVWDVVEGKWKSFRISKVNSFRTPDELTQQDKSGQDVESSQSQQLKNRKKTAKEKFEERIQKLKEEAKKSKDNFK